MIDKANGGLNNKDIYLIKLGFMVGNMNGQMLGNYKE